MAICRLRLVMMDIRFAQKWKEQIKVWAKELGFVSIGFTEADGHPNLAKILAENEMLGIATPFVAYSPMERTEPKAVWPACKTVVALAYPLPLSRPPQVGEGVLARSAVGEDYHRVLRGKLERLLRFIRDSGWPDAAGYIQVDTGPLNERGFAARAGVGWIGRNQQLIVPGYGSFVTLGLLLLDQALPADQPLPERCGECRSCVTACPVQLLGNKPVRGEQCLSYLTQSKEEFTPEQTRLMGNRIFGCDTCQEACPYNRERLEQEQHLTRIEQERVAEGGAGASGAEGRREGLSRGVDLLEILSLTGSGFKVRFAHTAAAWRGKGILQRNAMIALRNSKDSS